MSRAHRHAAEDAIELRRRQAIHALEQAAEHRPVFVEHRVVAVLEQVLAVDLDLLADDVPAGLDKARLHHARRDQRDVSIDPARGELGPGPDIDEPG